MAWYDTSLYFDYTKVGRGCVKTEISGNPKGMCGFKKHTTYAIVFLRTHLVFLSSSVCYEVSTNNSESEVK